VKSIEFAQIQVKNCGACENARGGLARRMLSASGFLN